MVRTMMIAPFLVLVLAAPACGSGPASCNSIDPTEAAFPVTLLNDTGLPVIVIQCDVTCAETHQMDPLAAGARVTVNTDGCGVDKWWLIRGGGRTLGCVDLLFYSKQDDVVVPLSRMTS